MRRPFIRVDDFAKLQDRCEVGSVLVARGRPEYEDGAVVPAGDWQAIPGQPEERRPAATVPAALTIELVQVPRGLRPTREQLLGLAAGPTDQDFFGGQAEAEYLGAGSTPAQALTATVNPASSRRLGLHLDNWDRLPYERRLESRRRLCLNVGPGARYLLVADMDALSIRRSVHADVQGRCPRVVLGCALARPMTSGGAGVGCVTGKQVRNVPGQPSCRAFHRASVPKPSCNSRTGSPNCTSRVAALSTTPRITYEAWTQSAPVPHTLV